MWTATVLNYGDALTEDSSCAGLSVFAGAAEPLPGTDLPYCRTNNLQCCTACYFERYISDLRKDLTTGAQSDVQAIFIPWVQAFDYIIDSTHQFINMFTDNFPFPHDAVALARPYLDSYVEPVLTSQLDPSYDVDLSFDFPQFVFNLTGNLIDVFTQNIPFDNNQQQCLDALLHEHLGLDAIRNVGKGIKQLQLILQSMQKIKVFLNQLNVTDLGYRPVEECIEALVSLHCNSCQENIPSLCENVCSYVVIGCQSPLQDGLYPQLDVVWNVTAQLVMLMQDVSKELLRVDQPAILPATAFETLQPLSVTNCSIDLYKLLGLTRRKKRSIESIPLPPSLESAINQAFLLSGVFKYENSLPHFCTHTTTSTTDCWNGEQQVTNGSLLYNLGPTINEQDNNPVFSPNLRKLYEQAASLQNPTSDFFQTSNFQETIPDNILIPKVLPLNITYDDIEISTTFQPSTTSQLSTTSLSSTPTATTLTTTIGIDLNITTDDNSSAPNIHNKLLICFLMTILSIYI